MRLSELIEINNRFEKSINLSLDLEDKSKIDFYIPTHSSVKILGKYISRIKSNNIERATVLIGPYGKGKSHLILVLLNILRKEKSDEIEKLIARIGAIDGEVEKEVRDLYSDGKPFLPVLISSSKGSLAQIFSKSLYAALKRAGLDDVLPENYFTAAIDAIENWKNNYANTYKLFCDEVNDIDSFIEKLRKFDEATLEMFRKLYPQFTAGSNFNPNVEDDIKTLYASVNRQLKNKHGYSGIYIVFDEFSKYIEGHSGDGFAADMMTLQDMCEYCSKSKDEQAHLTIITHKAIKEYGNKLPAEILNTFKAIEGRLQEEYFIVSSQNNYELIADALAKTEYFDTWRTKDPLFKEIETKSYEQGIFKSLFSESDYKEIVSKGAFPLSPISASLLLALSEKIAQNERTIFTYLTDTSSNGLARVISGKNEAQVIGASNIYDYFVPLFREDGQTIIHHEWLKADYALSKTSDIKAQEVVKTLAVIRMVNRPDDLPASEEIIRLASAMSEEEFNVTIERLIRDNLIEFKSRARAYEFKNNIGVDVETAIEDCIQKYFTKADIADALDSILAIRNIIPKRHNLVNRMTRYFNCHFMTWDQFVALKSTKYLKWNNNPDGVIVFLLGVDETSKEEVMKHLADINDSCLMTIIPKNTADCIAKVQMILAVRRLKTDPSFIEGNQVLRRELDDIEEDLTAQVNEWINEEYFTVDNAYVRGEVLKVGSRGLNRTVSDVCDSAYSLTPIINHELINRHNLSAQIAKARNTIIDDILNGRNDAEKALDYENGSSAEATIYRAVIIHTKEDKGVSEVRKTIDTFIKGSVGNKKSFESLVDELIHAPFGLRKGVLAIYLTEAFMKLGDIPVIYLGNKEISLNSETIANLVKKPADYSLYVEEETVQKNEYLNKLSNLFDAYSTNCLDIDKRNRLAKVSCMMQSWYRSLPQTSRNYQTVRGEGQNIKEIAAFRKIFNDIYLNPREILFERIPKVLKTEDLDKLFKKISDIKQDVDNYIHILKEETIVTLQRTIGLEAGADIGKSITAWYEELPSSVTKTIFASRTDDLFKVIKRITSSDREDIIGKIAKAVTGIFIEDWNDNTVELFEANLNEILHEIENRNLMESDSKEMSVIGNSGEHDSVYYQFDEANISTNGSFFKNALVDTLEEYGDAVEINEKIGILMNMVNELLKQEQE